MTSSLVGSEMCIRDSSKPAPRATPAEHSSQFAAASRSPYIDFSKSCLVYTSDDADDMQCVDLGGR
eukprot:9300960-Prorocentrum_lima.AAC.1